VNRFPSAADGRGFAPLAAKIHSMGLKFGLHLMRGIPRQAVERNLPVFGSDYHAKDVANTASVCPWNTDMYGVDMSKSAGQIYYNSVFKQFANWGVDFVKVDDTTVPPWAVAKFGAKYYADEVAGLREAIRRSGRKMVLSLSPGEAHFDAADHLSSQADMWRISDDFWDDWHALEAQFARCAKWAGVSGPGHWPDADMLPLGKVRFGEPTKFTLDEQKTMLSLWAMFRSPLMLGCDLTKLDDSTLGLITNKTLIEIDQHSTGGRQVSRVGDEVIWQSEGRNGAKYLALFNLSNQPKAIVLDRAALGLQHVKHAFDIWSSETLEFTEPTTPTPVPGHGVRLLEIRQ
jgi:hypothetical protein